MGSTGRRACLCSGANPANASTDTLKRCEVARGFSTVRVAAMPLPRTTSRSLKETYVVMIGSIRRLAATWGRPMRSSPPIGRNTPRPMPRAAREWIRQRALFQGPQQGGPDERIMLGHDAISDMTLCKIGCDGDYCLEIAETIHNECEG